MKNHLCCRDAPKQLRHGGNYKCGSSLMCFGSLVTQLRNVPFCFEHIILTLPQNCSFTLLLHDDVMRKHVSEFGNQNARSLQTAAFFWALLVEGLNHLADGNNTHVRGGFYRPALWITFTQGCSRETLSGFMECLTVSLWEEGEEETVGRTSKTNRWASKLVEANGKDPGWWM